jgi:hypothetical protein
MASAQTPIDANMVRPPQHGLGRLAADHLAGGGMVYTRPVSAEVGK